MAQKFLKNLIPTDYEEYETKKTGICVVGAGLPRTGTMSLRAALNIILEGNVYHMGEVFKGGSEHAQFWMDFQDGEH